MFIKNTIFLLIIVKHFIIVNKVFRKIFKFNRTNTNTG